MSINSSAKTLESMSQAQWYNQWTKNHFERYLSGEILEIGCGIGNFSKYLSKYGNLTAIDINEEYLKMAKKRIFGQAEVGFGDIERGEYFFNNRKFNCVVCINVLEHIKDDVKAIRNIHKLLTPGGFLIILVPAHRFLYNSIDKSIGHFRRYEKREFEKILIDNGMEVLRIKSLNFLGIIGWFMAGKLFREKQVSEMKIKIFNLVSPIFLLTENLFELPIGTSILTIARKI